MSEKKFIAESVFVKEFSFNSPISSDLLSKKWVPKNNYDFQSQHRQVGEDLYEILLKSNLKVDAEFSDISTKEKVFEMNIVQSGIFTIKGFNELEIDRILSATAPGILYPYVRETFSNFVQKSGFQGVYLPIINFDELYEQQQKSGSVN
jgi:preprotein translocase subunit SecB